MTWSATGAAERLDEFLEGAGGGTRLGELLETIGLGLALPAIVVGVGLFVFLVGVHRGNRRETRALLAVMGSLGLLTLVGGIVGLIGVSKVVGGGILATVVEGTARGAVARVVAGMLVAVGFIGARPGDQPWVPRRRQIIGVVGIGLGALSLAVDGHTISEGNPVLHVTANIIHVLAAGVWVGGVAALLYVVRARRRGGGDPVAPLVARFSSMATLALVAVAAAGLAMSLLIIDGVDDYWSTPWGRLLLVKVALVALAASLGAYNHFSVVPRLDTDPHDGAYVRRLRLTLAAEGLVLLAVAVTTVFLTEASTN
ncbi:MAG: CopD family protein [Acidimicrobiia bacterium]